MDSPDMAYCYACGGWRELNAELMCGPCYSGWLVAYHLKPVAIMNQCDIS